MLGILERASQSSVSPAMQRAFHEGYVPQIESPERIAAACSFLAEVIQAIDPRDRTFGSVAEMTVFGIGSNGRRHQVELAIGTQTPIWSNDEHGYDLRYYPRRPFSFGLVSYGEDRPNFLQTVMKKMDGVRRISIHTRQETLAVTPSQIEEMLRENNLSAEQIASLTVFSLLSNKVALPYELLEKGAELGLPGIQIKSKKFGHSGLVENEKYFSVRNGNEVLMTLLSPRPHTPEEKDISKKTPRRPRMVVYSGRVYGEKPNGDFRVRPH